MTALKIGINTYSYVYRLGALEAMLHLGTLGYRAFEVLVTPPHFWPPSLSARERRDIPRTLKRRGLHVTSLNLPSLDSNLVAPTAEVRRFTVATLAGMIEIAGAWGIPYLIVIPGKLSAFLPPPQRWLQRWLAEALAELAEAAEAAGTMLLIENVSVAYLPTAAEIKEALDAIGDSRLGIIYDVANAVFSGTDPAHDIPMIRDRMRLVHLSDTPATRWRHDPVGTGIVDFAKVAASLRAVGYAGECMLEIVSPRPDEDIVASQRTLARWGWEPPVG